MKIGPASLLLHVSISTIHGFHVSVRQRFRVRVSPSSSQHSDSHHWHAASAIAVMPSASSSSSSYLQDCGDETAYTTATVDYSAANEYVRAHYNQSQYFFGTSGTPSSKVEQQVYSGRILQTHYKNEREMLAENGLAIIESPIITEYDEPINWSDVNDIQSKYLPELERIITNNLFSSSSSQILGYCFWNPMMRGETCQISRSDGSGTTQEGQTPTASIASLVHIDTDVGAYESIQEFLNIVDKNKVHAPSSLNANTQTDIKEMAYQIIHERKRFAIINFWRNIGNEPVASAPLAILSTRYDNSNEPQQHRQRVFPDASPNMNKSKWYIFPNATKEEVIVFYQYDRNMLQSSDLWHCAISMAAREQTGQTKDAAQLEPRRSFDIRALVVLDETVPYDLDRFSSDRTRPMLTFDESGCFCDEQAVKRTEE